MSASARRMSAARSALRRRRLDPGSRMLPPAGASAPGPGPATTESGPRRPPSGRTARTRPRRGEPRCLRCHVRTARRRRPRLAGVGPDCLAVPVVNGFQAVDVDEAQGCGAARRCEFGEPSGAFASESPAVQEVGERIGRSEPPKRLCGTFLVGNVRDRDDDAVSRPSLSSSRRPATRTWRSRWVGSCTTAMR